MLLCFIIVLASTSGEDSGDYLRCSLCIVLCSGYMAVETPIASICFMLAAFVWGFVLQPAVLNHCHLTVWLLVFGALRNWLLAESGWGFATVLGACRVI